MGLIRKAILIGAVIAAMPVPPPDGTDQTQVATQSTIGAGFAYVAALSGAVSDAKGFCGRQPQVCSTAQYFATNLQYKAKYSARLIYQWANEAGVATKPVNGEMVAQAVAKPDAPVAPVPALRKKTHVNVADNSDLEIEDLINEMHGTLPPAKDPKKG